MTPTRIASPEKLFRLRRSLRFGLLAARTLLRARPQLAEHLSRIRAEWPADVADRTRSLRQAGNDVLHRDAVDLGDDPSRAIMLVAGNVGHVEHWRDGR